jgi:hypothetical protein
MILLFGVLAAAVPPAPSGARLPPGAVEILDPIAVAVGRYDACLVDGFRRKHRFGIDDADRHRREMDKVIAACAPVRAVSIAEAERALAATRDYSDPVKRDLAIRHAFEGTEEMRREFRAHVEAGVYGAPKLTAPPPVVVPAGTMPAVMEYVACLSGGFNEAARERIATAEARRARADAVDAKCRADAVDALPRITSGRITKLNEAGLNALNKAMDQLGADTREAFVDPQAMFRRRQAIAAGNGNADAPN